MPKTKAQKKAMLESLSGKFERAKAVIFAGFDKMTVAENSALRNRLKSENSEFLVAKKTLLGLALKKQDRPDAPFSGYKGQIAAIFGYGDEAVPARIIKEFKKEHEDKIDFLGGILEGEYIAKEQAMILADLPGKEELLSRVVGSLNAPISGVVNVLAANLRGLATVLSAIKDKKAS